MSFEPGREISHYRLIEKIGEGGMGEVFKARDTKLNRDVAMKFLPAAVAGDRERMARFEREAQVLASLNHPHVGAIYGIEDAGDSKALVLELIEGAGLNQRIKDGPLPIDEALQLAEQIAAGLEAAHEKGIIHRDLKPANVKITHDGSAKVLDFGLAKAMDDSAATGATEMTQSPTFTMATQAGVVLGTAAYMAPEQARGKPTDRRADVWAFGVVLYEMLTAHHLFGGDTVTDILAAVVRADPEWERLPAETPPALKRLLRRCLEKNPAKRLRDIGDVRLELREMIEGTEPEADGFTPAVQPASAVRRLLPWGVAVVAAFIAFGLGVVSRGPEPAPEVLRATILPPEGKRFNLSGPGPGAPTFSPDGRMLAFTAVGEDGLSLLYVRRLDAPEAHALTGTEGAQYPFWSPDGRYIGFFTRTASDLRERALKKVPVAGGPPVKLCDAYNGKGGTWSRDGVIVFAPSFDSPIHRVSDSGGESVAITTVLADSAESSHRHPYLLPDGRQFLYLVRRTTNRAVNEIRLASIDGGESRVLMTSDAGAVFASGQILYVVGGMLLARPFDPGSGRLGNEVTPVVEDVAVIAGAEKACFSASERGDLVFVAGTAVPPSRLVWYGPSGTRGGVLGDEAAYQQLVLSPDGSMAAVTIMDSEGGAGDFWMYEIERNLRTRFTFGAGDEYTGAWSPDGKRFYYVDEGAGTRIFVKTVGGSEEAEPVSEHAGLYPNMVSPDGRYIHCDRSLVDSGWDLWAVPTEPGGELEPVLQTPFLEVDGHLSPNGEWLAYVSTESGRTEVYVKPYPGPGRKWQVSTAGGENPLWSHDGRRLYYQGNDNQSLFAVAIEPQEETLIIDPPTLVLEGTFDSIDYRYAVAPDGRLLIVEPAEEQETAVASLVINWDAALGR